MSTPRLTDERLREIRARLDARTAGEWVQGDHSAEMWHEGPHTVILSPTTPAAGVLTRINPFVGTDADAALMAAAPSDLAALVDEVEKLRAELAEERATRFRLASMVSDARGEAAALRELLEEELDAARNAAVIIAKQDGRHRRIVEELASWYNESARQNRDDCVLFVPASLVERAHRMIHPPAGGPSDAEATRG